MVIVVHALAKKVIFMMVKKSGDFSIIQSINGVLLVLITGISGHSCIIFGAIKMAEHVSEHHFLGGSR